MSIEIANEADYSVAEETLLAVARYTLDEMGINPLAELSMLIVDEAYIAELNSKWMDKTGPTDVLAFPMDELDSARRPGGGPSSADSSEEPTLLGDIVLCPAYAAKQAAVAGHSVDEELQMLTVHGILHLLGYDHEDPEEKKEMFSVQDRILTSWQRTDSE